MNVGYYLLCLLLLLPLAGLTVFGLFIESLIRLGFWATLWILLSPLFDPLGKGIWVYLFLLGGAAALSTGLFRATRAVGFALLAVAGVCATAFVLVVYPDPMTVNTFVLLSPSSCGIALSTYCALRTYRKNALPQTAGPVLV